MEVALHGALRQTELRSNSFVALTLTNQRKNAIFSHRNGRLVIGTQLMLTAAADMKRLTYLERHKLQWMA